MVDKIDYRGVLNPVRAVPESEQRELLASYEPSEIYNLGRGATHDDVIRQQRQPRAIVVSDAALLGEQRGNKAARFDSFLWFKNEIHRRGGWFEEARTRLRSNRPNDWIILRRTAEAACGRLAQGAKSALNAKKGKKPWTATRDEKDLIRSKWYRAPGRTVDDAVAEIAKLLGKKAPGRTVLYREFGEPVTKRK